MAKYNKINSFSQSPSAPQIVSYLIFILSLLLYGLVIQNYYLNQSLKIGANIAYALLTSLQFLSTLFVSISDPSDDIMISCKNQQFDLKEIQNLLYCQACFAYVKKKSKHCRRCDRCVQDFDHHCVWINNCIGSKNYKGFLVMICSSFLSFICFLAFMILLWGEDNYKEYLFQMVFVWIFSVVVLILAVLILLLIVFHIYLIYSKITTFQYFQSGKEDENINITLKTLQNNDHEIAENQPKQERENKRKMGNRVPDQFRQRREADASREYLKKKAFSSFIQLQVKEPKYRQTYPGSAKLSEPIQLKANKEFLYKIKSQQMM